MKLKVTEVNYLGDHKLRTFEPPRALDAWESRAIERIMSWPETEPRLSAAVKTVSVHAECEECASVFLAGSGEPLLDANGQPVYGAAPGELWSGEGGTRTHVIIHIAEGRVDHIQVYREDGQPATERPDVEAMNLTSS
ncbi:MAG: hypothetical protein ACXWWL_08105 [Candidatus Limnocylindria bacterium]